MASVWKILSNEMVFLSVFSTKISVSSLPDFALGLEDITVNKIEIFSPNGEIQ